MTGIFQAVRMVRAMLTPDILGEVLPWIVGMVLAALLTWAITWYLLK